MKIVVTVLDGNGMPQTITVEVPDDATQEQIQEAIEKAKQASA